MRNKSKIEKIELGKVIKSDRFWSAGMIIEKINELIDAYNSQAQPEESSVEDWKKTYGVERAISSDALKVKQDTPEEWEEVNKDIWYMVGGKKYVSINGEKYVRTSDLEQLLDERERKVRKQERMIRLHKRVSKKIDNLEEPYKSFAKAGAGII